MSTMTYVVQAPPSISIQPRKCVLLGLKQSVLDMAVSHLRDPAFTFILCLSTNELKEALESHSDIDHVFIGAGLDNAIRLEATQIVLENSLVTQVHLKHYAGGPQGYLPFIRTVLLGIKAENAGTNLDME